MFGELVKFTANFLKRGRRVVLHCRRGHRRTGIAIYLVLRYLGRLNASCLRTMRRMRPEMHRQFVMQTRSRELHRMAQGIFADNVFKLRLAFDEL